VREIFSFTHYGIPTALRLCLFSVALVHQAYIIMISAFKICANWNFVSLRRTLSTQRKGRKGHWTKYANGNGSSRREDRKVLHWTKYAEGIAKSAVANQTKGLIESRGINWDTWKEFCNPLCTLFLQNPVSFVDTHRTGSDADFNIIFETNKPSKRNAIINDLFLHSILLPIYYREENAGDNQDQISSATDLRAPHEWYPETRSMVRKVVFHCGPTNSGKVTLSICIYYVAFIICFLFLIRRTDDGFRRTMRCAGSVRYQEVDCTADLCGCWRTKYTKSSTSKAWRRISARDKNCGKCRTPHTSRRRSKWPIWG